uniref:Uncharacterized protein n=1 Tax=Myoviridae sp. ctBoB21 TaxID=2827287 RepID=A0A8S5R5I6_9CAUD|nr:MAG TPA: hypothetical protein [Myoviridae sp. ctBoB21]
MKLGIPSISRRAQQTLINSLSFEDYPRAKVIP